MAVKENGNLRLLCAAVAAGTAATRLGFLPAVLIGGVGALVRWW
ncbi:hypothetical protein ACSNOI_36035 [Actinomadura kijaniata]